MSTRRNYLKTLALAGMAGGLLPELTLSQTAAKRTWKKISIATASSNFEREPLARPFGFKGGYLTELWQVAAMLESSSGFRKVGLGTQSTLWSDPEVYSANPESAGNALMYAITNFALKRVRGQEFETPLELLDGILDECVEYGRRVTGNPKLRETFVLNALVALDNAAWQLLAAENQLTCFDEMLPPDFRTTLNARHNKAATIPLISYGVPMDKVSMLADEGDFFFKIKLGHPGTQQEMLEQDQECLSAIHKTLAGRVTPHTESGKLLYYFDANGRYERKQTLLRFLDHARKIGAAEQIAMIEEPFPEEAEIEVSDLPVRIAADESAHTDASTLARFEMGYTAVALKPIAKTLSMSLKIAALAAQRKIPCFCADLTVNPILVDWNKNVAARLPLFPGVKTALLETNGAQNYRHWDHMEQRHPYPKAAWRHAKCGVFSLDEDFYAKSGGILADSPHYLALFDPPR